MILISALTEDRVIGAGEGMPWDVPEEYQQYLDFTRGQTIILGRRSMEIFGAELSASHAVVLTRSGNVKRPGGYAGDLVPVGSIDDAVKAARSFGKTSFCGGGGEVYRACMPRADAMYLSFIKGRYEGDTYFPAFQRDEWRVADQRNHARFRFVSYRRR